MNGVNEVIMRSFLLGICLSMIQACGGLDSSSAEPETVNLVLNNSESILSFVSIKNDAIGEVHRFNALSGFLTEQDKANIDVDLTSVSTGIEIRDQRMTEHLFNTAQFAKSSISVPVTGFALNTLTPGESLQANVDASLSLHGVTQSIPVAVSVVRLMNGGIQVQSNKAVILNAASFGLSKGIDKLAELAGLSSITSAVPVNFTLVFDPV